MLRGLRGRVTGFFAKYAPFDTTRLVEAQLKKRLSSIVENYLFGMRSTDSIARSGSMELLFQLLKGSDPYDRKALEAGDDARLIDWTSTARAGKALVRPPPPDARTFWVVIDASAHSWEGIVDRKWNTMVETAALIGCLTTLSEDLLGVAFVTDRVAFAIEPSTGKYHYYDVLYKLSRHYPRGRTDLPRALAQHMSKISPRSITFVLSGFQAFEEWTGGWRALGEVLHDMKKGNRFVQVIRVTDPIDDTLPDVGMIGIQHPEQSRVWMVDTHDPDLQQFYYSHFAPKSLEIGRSLFKVDPHALTLSTDTTLAQRVDLIYRGLADYLARLSGRGSISAR